MGDWWDKRNQVERVALIVGALLVVFAAIGIANGLNSTNEFDSRPPVEEPKTATDKADSYAYAIAGDRSGCSKGQASGCIYAAAFAACLEALEGRPFDSPYYRQQFPEARYFAAAKTAASDCSKPNGWNQG